MKAIYNAAHLSKKNQKKLDGHSIGSLYKHFEDKLAHRIDRMFFFPLNGKFISTGSKLDGFASHSHFKNHDKNGNVTTKSKNHN